MGGIIIVDWNLRRINEEARRRQSSAACRGEHAGGRQRGEGPGNQAEEREWL